MVCILLATSCLSNKLSHCNVWQWDNFSSWSIRDLFRNSAYMHLEYTGLFIRELTSGQITRCFFSYFLICPSFHMLCFDTGKRTARATLKIDSQSIVCRKCKEAHSDVHASPYQERQARQRVRSWSCLLTSAVRVGWYLLAFVLGKLYQPSQL